MKTNQNLSRLEGKEPASLSRSVCCPQGLDISRARANHIIPRTPTLRGDVSEAVTTAPVCGMTNAASGFTLIELLVVVLIIGILAAIALPQYQTAIDKARYMQAVTLITAAANADRVYFIENGEYAHSYHDLAIDLPTPTSDTSNGTWIEYSWGHCYFQNSDDSGLACAVRIGDGRAYYSVDLREKKRHCFATNATARAVKLCQSVTGKKKGYSSGPYTWFSF